MNCVCCNGIAKRRGFYRNKNFNVQRFECLKCGTSFSDKQPLDNLRVHFKQAIGVLNLLAEPACDSRTTDELGHIKDDADKLHLVTFNDGNMGIVGEAGNADMSSMAVEQILLLAKERPVNDYRALASCAEEAIANVKDKIRKQFKGSSEELQKHFEKYDFELMLAHYYKEKPYIFTLDFALGMAIKKDKGFSAIGCGWQLADFLIGRLDLSEFTIAHGMWTAV